MMTPKEKEIVPQVIINDLKYLSVRRLYFDWFFNTGAEVANQLIDNIIKTYLKSIDREDLIKKIRSWGGNESHNILKIIEMLVAEISLDFDLNAHRDVLENLYKLYQNRYLDSVKITGNCKTLLKDIGTIDYTYKYFRDKINVNVEEKKEFLIDKLFLQGNDILWGEDKISLGNIFRRNNKYF